MKKQMSPLQKIGDFYFNLGLRGEKLRMALKKDKHYQKLLSDKKEKLTTKIKVSVADKQKYALATDKDFDILDQCKKLEKISLSQSDKKIRDLIKSQLLDDWRSPLLNALQKLLKKYKV